MSNHSCYVVDDHPAAVDMLKQYIEQCNELRLLRSSTNPIEFLQKMGEGMKPDIVFLDIDLPQINGIGVAKLLQDKVQIIFVTGYPEHAADSYDTNCADFLRKPFSYSRFYEAVLKAIRRIEGEAALQTVIKLGANVHIKKPKTDKRSRLKFKGLDKGSFFLKSRASGMIEKHNFSEVTYIKGLADYVEMFDLHGDKKILHFTMTELENQVPSFCIRIHRSYFINLLSFDHASRTHVFLKGVKDGIPVGKEYKNRLKHYLDKRFLGSY